MLSAAVMLARSLPFAVLAIVTIACGGGTAGTTPAPTPPAPPAPAPPAGPPAPTVPDDAMRTLATSYCEGMSGCCTKIAAGFDAAACATHAETELRAALAERLVPYATYDASQLDGCAAALRARAALCIEQEAPRTCGLLVPDSIRKACDGLVHGTLGDDAACSSPQECVSRSCYSRTDRATGRTLPSTCAGSSPPVVTNPTCLGTTCEGALQCVVDRCEWPPQAPGSACTFDDQCGASSFCSAHAGNTCQPQGKSGETCWDFTGSDCVVGYACMSAGGTPPGTCQPDSFDTRGTDPDCAGKSYPYRVDAARCAALAAP